MSEIGVFWVLCTHIDQNYLMLYILLISTFLYELDHYLKPCQLAYAIQFVFSLRNSLSHPGKRDNLVKILIIMCVMRVCENNSLPRMSLKLTF